MPRFGQMTDSEILTETFKLGDAQELVARQHGFESWQALKTGVKTMSDHAATIATKTVIVGAERDSGLPVWTAADRPIENTDVVLWHVFGLLHETRPEDWPVMPTESASFQLRPVGFFDRNPSLDVPPPEHCRTSHA